MHLLHLNSLVLVDLSSMFHAQFPALFHVALFLVHALVLVRAALFHDRAALFHVPCRVLFHAHATKKSTLSFNSQ